MSIAMFGDDRAHVICNTCGMSSFDYVGTDILKRYGIYTCDYCRLPKTVQGGELCGSCKKFAPIKSVPNVDNLNSGTCSELTNYPHEATDRACKYYVYPDTHVGDKRCGNCAEWAHQIRDSNCCCWVEHRRKFDKALAGDRHTLRSYEADHECHRPEDWKEITDACTEIY